MGERPSFNSKRFWEVSGGIVRSGRCGWAMGTTTVSSTGLYYRCRGRIMYGKDVCDMKKHLRADLVEPLVWEGVSEVLGKPETLRRGLQRMLEKEQEASAVDHEGKAHIWQEKLSEIGRKRANFQELTAEDLLEAYEERCVEALEDLSPVERREVYKLLNLTVEAYPDGRLEAAWALNAYVSKVRPRSRPPCGLCP